MSNAQFVSIIIPTFNNEKYIRDCLRSLFQQNYNKDAWEILVVDNGSSDRTLEIARGYSCKIIEKCVGTISSSRNAGAAQSKGDILAFIDSDCIAPPNWLKEAIELLDKSGAGAVGAEYSLPTDTTWVERTWYLNTTRRKVDGETDWLPSCNLIVLRQYFERVGGFNEKLVTTEDVDFSHRIRALGAKIISNPKLSVIHLRNSKSVKEFFEKERWRGMGVLKIKPTKAFGFGLYTIACLLLLVAGIFYGLFTRKWQVFITAPFLLLTPPFGLAILTCLKRHTLRSLIPLTYLYFVYGVARGTSMLSFSNWRDHN